MAKKAQFGLTLFFAALVIILLASLVLLYVQFLQPSPLELKFKGIKADVASESFSLSYLRTPVGDADMAQLITHWYETGKNSGQIIKETNTIMSKLHGKNICWELEVEDKSIENEDDCEDLDEEKSQIIIPSSSGTPLKLTITR